MPCSHLLCALAKVAFSAWVDLLISLPRYISSSVGTSLEELPRTP